MTDAAPRTSFHQTRQGPQFPLTLVLITLNEAANLQRCLQSVPFVDEIVVLDSGSQDGTRELAQRLGATVHQEAWRGFGPQKQRAVELAKNDWVLCLDADEELSSALAEEIVARFAGLDPQVAYGFSRLSFYLGRWIRHGGWYPDPQYRLFHRQHAQWSLDPIHESVQAAQKQKLAGDLHHYVFRDIQHHLATNNRYSTLQAEQAVRQGRRFSQWRYLLKPLVKFFECYIFKAGFLDGAAGFFIAVNAGVSVFWRWAKIRELEIKKERQTT